MDVQLFGSERIIDEGGFADVQNLMFKEEAVEDLLIFQTPFTGYRNLYCTERFRTSSPVGVEGAAISRGLGVGHLEVLVERSPHLGHANQVSNHGAKIDLSPLFLRCLLLSQRRSLSSGCGNWAGINWGSKRVGVMLLSDNVQRATCVR